MYQNSSFRQQILRLIGVFLLAAHTASSIGFAGERRSALTGVDVHKYGSTNGHTSAHGRSVSPSIEVLAVTGDVPPDGDGTFDFNSNWTALTDSGDVVFTATIVGTTRRYGIYRATPAGTIEVARSFEQTDPDTIIDRPGLFAANSTGSVAFNSIVDTSQNSNANDSAVYLGDGCLLTQVAREGDLAPRDGILVPSRIRSPALNGSGSVLFSAFLSETTGGDTDDEGLYRWDDVDEALIEIARKGNLVSEGAEVLGAFWGFADLNDAGQTAFIASTDTHNVAGIYRGDGGPLTRIARIDEAAPGEGTYDRFGPGCTVPINNAGHVAFRAELAISGEFGRPNAIFFFDGTSVERVVRQGNTVPDGDGQLGTIHRNIDLNESGNVAFIGNISQPADPHSNEALFMGDGNTMALAARRLQAAPGGGFFTFFDRFSINDEGQVAFSAHVGFDAENITHDEYGVFLYDPGSGLFLVARTGMPLLGATISELVFAGTSRGRVPCVGSIPPERSGFNNAGEVAFSFKLTDQNGLEGIGVWRIPRDPLDFDGSGDVDPSDALALIECLTGPVDHVAPCCAPKDLDDDDDVDLLDFALFQVSLAGF